MKRIPIALGAVALVLVAGAGMAGAQMQKPDSAVISGTLIDMTCAAKGKALMDSWVNAENDDHMTPEGKKAACATMCLKGGQPAGVFKDGGIAAVLACNPRATLADYAAQDVELKGFWAGSSGDAARTFVPQQIRPAGGDWQEVDCATMHG